MINILDCTLRDGGYYNNWDFNTAKAEELIRALNKAGVQIIEVGYKSPAKDSFFGLFKYCNEDFLDFLSKDDPSDYAFMIDVKEFIRNGEVDTALLDECIRPASESVFSWVRLATHFATVETIPAFTEYFHRNGYKVCYNLMGGSLLKEEELKRGAEIAGSAGVDVFYLADSFGSFYPGDIRKLVRFLKQYYKGTIGIHTHDNQGMAYANTMAAIEEGVQFVDATVTGMGRGAGNLMTEQFLLGYAKTSGNDRYRAEALLPIITEYINPMKMKHRWGFDFTYMLSGLNNIHPSYCQALIETNRFTNEEVSEILENIPQENRAKFNRNILNKAIEKLLEIEQSSVSGESVGLFDISQLKSKQVIIVARGSSAREHMPDILRLARKNDIPVVECNLTNYFEEDFHRFLVILNQLKLNNWVKNGAHSKKVQVITGIPVQALPEEPRLSYFPFRIGSFNPFAEELNIPDYDAGIYAIALAMHAGCRDILLAGFDGHSDQDLQLAKEALFQQIMEVADRRQVTISHITPTNYQAFNHKSLYTV